MLIRTRHTECFVLFWIFVKKIMIIRLLDKQLQNSGFMSFKTNLSNVITYIKSESGYINLIRVIEINSTNTISHDLYISSGEELKKTLCRSRDIDIHMITLVFYDNYSSAAQMVGDDYMCWLIDKEAAQLCEEEGRVEEFYGLKEMITALCAQYRDMLLNGDIRGIDELSHNESEKKKIEKLKQKKPIPITLILVSVNIIIFLTGLVVGNAFVKSGNMDPMMINKGEYYRLLTPMFLHAGIDHLFSNMILLYFLGEIIESKVGSVRFSVIYIFSGIIGNVVSYLYSFYYGGYTSIGASGAVFGLIGAFVILVIKKYKGINVPKARLILMIAYSIYSSFSANVDFAAHIGGLIAGILITFIITMGGKKHEG